MKAIILSAGQGSRLLPLTESMPKCCLMLDGKPLLVHQIESLAANGVNEVVVVTGFNHRVVEDVVAEISIPGTSVRTLYNPFYAVSDNLGTTWVAREEMHSPFLLVNGDTLFEASTLAQLLSSEWVYPITLAVDRKGDYDDDDMKISADGEQLMRVGKKLNPEIVNGESIGMMAFNQAGARAFVEKVENLMASPDGLARWYLSAIDEMAVAGMVGISSIQGHDWCEVDDLVDFAHAGKAVASWRDRAVKPGSDSSSPKMYTRKKAA
jgi:choline kinase